ncbi:MAG: hypothetical protein J6T47_10335 [Lachnospiraceae bacterium]|nr:hypothetical protein [Lachnospiraceae bacterium]
MEEQKKSLFEEERWLIPVTGILVVVFGVLVYLVVYLGGYSDASIAKIIGTERMKAKYEDLADYKEFEDFVTYQRALGEEADLKNTYQVVDFSDHVFVGIVEKYIRTNVGDYPETIYAVRVVENLKGDLEIDSKVEVTKVGGLNRSNRRYVLFSDDILPRVGQTYIFSARSSEDEKGKLQLRCALPNMTVRLSGSDGYREDSEYIEYKEACQAVVAE